MTTSVIVTINTQEQRFAGGTVGGDWRIDVALASAPTSIIQTYDGAAPTTTFDLQDSETYVITGYRLDAAGSLIGPMASTQYTTGDNTVSISVADTITVTPVPPSAPLVKTKK